MKHTPHHLTDIYRQLCNKFVTVIFVYDCDLKEKKLCTVRECCILPDIVMQIVVLFTLRLWRMLDVLYTFFTRFVFYRSCFYDCHN
jgi:hypothetical protein